MAHPPENAPESADRFGAEFAQRGEHEKLESRRLRRSLTVAFALHLVLLAVTFPEIYSEEAQPEKAKKVFVIEQVRFKRPEPPPPEAPRPQPTRQVPVPDMTPDDPEPPPPVEIEPVVDFADVDPLFAIPDAPPEPPAPDPVGPIEVGGEVSKPECLSCPNPRYTEIARRARVQGLVIVKAVITREGDVAEIEVLEGVSMGLTEAAVDAVKTWKFKPGTLHGKPVDVYYRLTVNFELN